ncbi:MAG: hypothetical protein ACJ73E_13710 [Mycobacteriales bacterium]
MFLTPQETTLGAAAVAALAALAGVYLTGRRDDRKVRQERQRQDTLERERWKREDRSIWADRRFEAHGAFAHATLEALRYCESAGEYTPELSNSPRDPQSMSPLVLRNRAVSDALVMLELRATAPVREAAEAAADTLRQASASAYTIAGGRAGPEQVETWTDLTKRAKAARDAYLDLAQAELGTA